MQNRTPIPRDQRPPLPDFTPVPRKYRHDGWTPERQRTFIDGLAETGSVKHAAQRINMSPEGAYYLRRQKGAEEFRAAWDAALDFGVQSLADVAIERAKEGVPVPIFYKGEQVGEKRWYNDRLLMFILKHHMPSKYGANLGGGTKHPETIAREAAEAAAAAGKGFARADRRAMSDEDVRAELVKRLHTFGIRVRAEQAEKDRALYERCRSDPEFRRAWETVNERSYRTLLGPNAEPQGHGDDEAEASTDPSPSLRT